MMRPAPADFISAARVPDSIRDQTFGPWTIKRRALPAIITKFHWPIQTILWKLTPATMHLEPGEIVMDDSWVELARHLPIWMAARGNVLITGLGLGCVVRGLLLKPEVLHITVVEIDPRIIRVCGAEFIGNPRVTIIQCDALELLVAPNARWDFAWHDLHCDQGRLNRMHIHLFKKFRDHCGPQGAWAFPDPLKRRVQLMGFPLLGGKRKWSGPAKGVAFNS